MVDKAKTQKIINQFTPKRTNIASTGGNSLELPNLNKGKAPESTRDLANKQYVDDAVAGGGAVEGTAVLSTGEGGATLFLREDGDGTCSWQTPAGAGDVSKVGTPANNELGVWTGDGTIEGESKVTFDGTAFHVDANITTTGSVDGIDIAGLSGFVTANSTHRGDTSGADHSALVTAVGLNSAKDTNIAHPLVEEAVPSGAVFTDTQLVEADITTMGFTKDVEVDWTADQGASNINAANYTNTTYAAGDFAHNSLADLNDGTSYEHITQTQKDALHTSGSDTALGAQSENLDMNTHKIVSLTAPSANGDAMRATAKITEAKMEAADDHVNDNTQAHSDYLLNSGTDIAAGPLTITADNSTADQAYVPMVLYNTDDTPPAASGFPVGTLYVQYTA